MASVYWLTPSGVAEAQPVCTVDFADECLAIDFAHQLYRSVHGFARSRKGFAIKDDDGADLYTWQWTGEATEPSSPEDLGVPVEAPAPVEKLPKQPSVGEGWSRRFEAGFRAVQETRGHAVVKTRAAFSRLHGLGRMRRGALGASVGHGGAKFGSNFGSWARQASAAWRRLAQWERPIKPADPDRIPPEVRPKTRRWRPEIDHYLLAIIVVLAALCGSPLYSIYSTVQRFQRDDSLVHKDGSGSAAATRNATKSALSTEGRLDLRKMFWHLRVVGPTEIHLLAYEPDDHDGLRLIFETSDMLRWRLRGIRGADGTWWT